MRVIVIAALAIALLAGQSVAAEKTDIKSEKGKRSYSVGYSIGKNLQQESFDIDPELVAKGVKDALSGKKGLMTDQEIQATLKAFQQELMTKKVAEMKVVADKNRKDGEAFLAENKTKPGIITLPSGIQYKVITEGKGATPKPASTVKAHYKGNLIDGTEFDSSYRRGEPSEFALDKVIAGWREILPMMKEGSKWQIFIPSDLGYGEAGRLPIIPQNSVLIFEVELIAVVK